MAVTALAPWFGSNRMLADKVGEQLDGCNWVGVPFGGGLCELRHIKARTIVVSDLHRHILNLARVAQDPLLSVELYERLTYVPFHEHELKRAQHYCMEMEATPRIGEDQPNVIWAVQYFICVWMSRNGTAGTEDEFRAPFSVRWEAAGGDSCVRFRSATEALIEWRDVMRNCTFKHMNVFDFLQKVKEKVRHGIYCDPPFLDTGKSYKHKFSEKDHARLADALRQYKLTKVVCRFYDTPEMRKLYPEEHWDWLSLDGRDQHNSRKPEVLVTTRL